MYRKQRQGWLKHIDFILIDMICMQIAYILAYVLRHYKNLSYELDIYRDMAIIFVFLNVFVASWTESYSGILQRGYYQEFFSAFKLVSVVIIISQMYLFWTQRSADYSRIIFGLMWVFNVILTWACRCIWKQFLKKRVRTKENSRSLIIVCGKKEAESIVETFEKHNYSNLKINGVVVMDDDLKGEMLDAVPVVSNAEEILNYLKSNWVDEVFVDLSTSLQETEVAVNLMEKCIEMGITVHTKLAKVAGMSSNQVVENLAGYTVLSSSVAMVTPKQLLAKRTLDILGALVGCFLTLIAILLIGPIIKFKSPGPIFFTQVRVGKNGKLFKLYKFRSMYMDAEARKRELMDQNDMKDDFMFKLDKDPRIISGIGHFIRKYSIDELPQFFNVIKGDMSLVGTRPPTTDEWKRYELHHRKRLAIKPGMTGMWQISGRSDITDFEEVVALDSKYIAEWNFGMDLRILWKTIGVVLTARGSK